MTDKIMNGESNGKLTKQEKVVSLFQFVEELNRLKQKIVLCVSNYPWWRSIASFPDDPENIKIYYRDRVEDEETENTNNILLSVHKPEFQLCPKPEPIFKEWLEKDWDDYHIKAKAYNSMLRPLNQIDFSTQIPEEYMQRIDEENGTYKEFFDDDEERVSAYTVWMNKRNSWVKKQKVLEETRDFFSKLYEICIELERDSETLE